MATFNSLPIEMQQVGNSIRIGITNAFSLHFAIRLIETHKSLEIVAFRCDSCLIFLRNDFTRNELFFSSTMSIPQHPVRKRTLGKLNTFSDKNSILFYLKVNQTGFAEYDNEIKKLAVFKKRSNITNITRFVILSLQS